MFEFIKKNLYKSYCDIWNGSKIYLKSNEECALFHENFYMTIFMNSNGLILSNSEYTYRFASYEFKLDKNVLTFNYEGVSYRFIVTVLSEREYKKELVNLDEKKFEDNVLKIKNFKNDIQNVSAKDVFEDLVRKTFGPFTNIFTTIDEDTRRIISGYTLEEYIHYNFRTHNFTYTVNISETQFEMCIKEYVESCVKYMNSYNNINFEQLKKISEILRKDS